MSAPSDTDLERLRAAHLTSTPYLFPDDRLPAYLAAMRGVAAHLGDWERRHRAELDAVRTAWRQRVTDAAHLPR